MTGRHRRRVAQEEGEMDEERRRQIEQALEREGFDVMVEAEGDLLRLEGRVETEEGRGAVEDIVAALAPRARLENNLEVEQLVPEMATEDDPDPVAASAPPESLAEAVTGLGSDVEPDFTAQELETSPVEMAGEAGATIDPHPDGETVYFAPTDPVVRPVAAVDGSLAVGGGFSPTADEEVPVPRSALDGRIGDEAIADAVRRELREDALTTDLAIRVVVRQGVVHLRGSVPTLDDAEGAEEVAGRVEGVREVVEELDVERL
jgi:osmotically-inducible protein OsmY